MGQRHSADGSGLPRSGIAHAQTGRDWHALDTLYAVPYEKPELDAQEQNIVALLTDRKGYSTQQIATTVGTSTRATHSRLRALVERGVLVEVGTSPQDPRRLYFVVGAPGMNTH